MKNAASNWIPVVALVLGLLMPAAAAAEDHTELETDIKAEMEAGGIAGLAACLIKGCEIAWSGGFGWADLEKRIPMSPDVLMNIGSISKTVTATAVMRLWEQGRFKLDDDVSGHLDFEVRNPRFSDAPVTFRQLLTHRSSVKDGPAYGSSYACGDPTVSLEDWIRGYFTPGGAYHDAERNWHTWRPGREGELPARPRNYSNVGFGLLGLLVEEISGMDFSGYTEKHIFEPLGMTGTAWHIAEIDPARHAVPYTRVEKGRARGQVMGSSSKKSPSDVDDGFLPNCLYSFPNYPDGLVRTSVIDLARFLIFYIRPGEGPGILEADTVSTMLSREHFGGGLCWFRHEIEGDVLWGHGGGDPGISTFMIFHPDDDFGLIVFANTGGAPLGGIVRRLLKEVKAP